MRDLIGRGKRNASRGMPESGLRELPWLYRARDYNEHRMRQDLSFDRENAKTLRITLLKLLLDVSQFVQQLPTSDGDGNLAWTAGDFRNVEAVSSPIRFLVNNPKIRRDCRSRLLYMPDLSSRGWKR
jgi:hypothetical protein